MRNEGVSASASAQRIKDCGSSREDVTFPIAPLFHTSVRIGSWDVSTMNEAGEKRKITGKMSRYKQKILCLTENLLTQSGQRHPESGEKQIVLLKVTLLTRQWSVLAKFKLAYTERTGTTPGGDHKGVIQHESFCTTGQLSKR